MRFPVRRKSRTGVYAMLNVVLVEPEIPANTGNIARTCAATGSVLHLVKPLGFDISEKAVRRAGLDYWHLVDIRVYENLQELFEKNRIGPMRLFSTKAPKSYAEAGYPDGCFLFFGKETKGLPESFLAEHYDSCVRIPIREEARSLNLSNSVAVGVFEALRQQNFPHLREQGKMVNWETEHKEDFI
jgi:tRNA (cytidine/uridine-2'-O-)-methyltransferase